MGSTQLPCLLRIQARCCCLRVLPHSVESPARGVCVPHPATGRRRAGLIALVALMLVGLAGTAGARSRSPLAGTPTSPTLPGPPWTGNLLIGNQGTFNEGTGGWSPSRGAHLLHMRK